MKICVVWGDLSSEMSSENYPTVPVCDACFKEQGGETGEDFVFVDDDFNPIYGNSCYYCGKTKQEEEEEEKIEVKKDQDSSQANLW